MKEPDKERSIREARELEKAGKTREAYDLYLRGGAPQEAARLLAATGRFDDAGKLILQAAGVSQPNDVAAQGANNRKLVFLAATYLSKGESTDFAVQLYLALGDRARAAEVLERKGDLLGAKQLRDNRTRRIDGGAAVGPRANPYPGASSSQTTSRETAKRLEQAGKLTAAIDAYVQLKQYADAARLLNQLNRPADAAGFYSEAGMPYEAAACYLKLGDTGKGLDCLVRLPRSDHRYRSAAAYVVRLASELNLLNFQVEHFLTELAESGPANDSELEVFYILSKLYERHNIVANAADALKKLLAKSPGYKDAEAMLARFERDLHGSRSGFTRIQREEAAFHDEQQGGHQKKGPDQLFALPDPPPMPGLPPPPKLDQPLAPAPPPRTFLQAASAQGTAPTAAIMPAVAPVSEAQPAAAPAADPGFVVGNTIAGRYLIDAKLGQGGMAIVFRARDLELDEDIALKVFLQVVADPSVQQESLARFKQELKLSRQLGHPNVIRLHDIGMHLGHRYLSMELLRGQSLEDLLRANPVDIARSLGYLVQACAGLQAAHDKGVVHRDIKPDNLFVAEDDTIKVMDFGIAKNTLQRGLTVAGMTAGTPEYMAPEQISSFGEVTAAADQYSLGVVAYRMVTGRLPFDHEELTPLLMMHLSKLPDPPKTYNPEVSSELDGVILKTLEKKPEQRFSSMKELASQFQQLRRHYRRQG